MKSKIALLIDSGTDLPLELIEKYHIYVLPLRIIFSDGEYIDKVTITTDQLLEKMKTEIPKTSLPTGADIIDVFDKIQQQGHEQVIVITISSNLSGTNNFIRTIAADYTALSIHVIDTKNISVASGLIALQAAEAIEAAHSVEKIVADLAIAVQNTFVFFTVGTLEYLKKGGRIGQVSATIGELLNIKPIISCNAEGIYYTVEKVRGKKKALNRMIDLAKDCIFEGDTSYRLAITHGNMPEEFELFQTAVLEQLSLANSVIILQVGPALSVHTGPDAFGVAIQIQHQTKAVTRIDENN